MRRLGLAAVIAVLAVPGAAAATDWETAASVELGTGVDSNALRESTAGDVTPDGFLGGVLRARAAAIGERARLDANLSEGLKLFFDQGSATLSVTRIDARGRAALGAHLVGGADLSLKDLTERGHLRDEDDARSTLVLELPTDDVRVSVQGGFALAAPRNAGLRSFTADGPVGGTQIAWTPSSRQTLVAGYEAWKKAYPRWSTPGGRDDLTQTLSAEYTWHGPFVAAFGYAFSWNASSASGGAYSRHRVTARGAAFLPLGISVAAQASLQRSFYPTGLLLQEELLLAENDENQNTIEVRFARPLSRTTELALKLAHYGNELSGGSSAIPFRRDVAVFAVVWRTPD